MTSGHRLYSADLNLNLAHCGVTQWCALLAHQCDGCSGMCGCTCHTLNRPPG